MHSINRIISYGSLAAFIVILDRLTKYYALHQHHVHSLPGISFEPSINRGLAWSLFSSDNAWLYGIVCCIAFLFFSFCCFYAYKRYEQHYGIWPEIMILSGAASNLIDRFIHQGVVDFISIEWGVFSWPSFNIADVAICLGALFIIVGMLIEKP